MGTARHLEKVLYGGFVQTIKKAASSGSSAPARSNTYIVFYTDDGKVRIRNLTTKGKPIGNETIAFNPGKMLNGMDVGILDNNVIVVWEEKKVPNKSKLRMQIFPLK